MLTLIALLGLYGGWRVARAAWLSLRALPQRNEDMVFF
jgi:hypothetical protein